MFVRKNFELTIDYIKAYYLKKNEEKYFWFNKSQDIDYIKLMDNLIE